MGQTPSAVLFDIDGTLITTGGAGGRSWAAAFRRIHGRDADITKFSETGMTDPMVGRSVFRGVMGRDPSQTELAQLIMGYLMELPNAVEESPGYRRLPG